MALNIAKIRLMKVNYANTLLSKIEQCISELTDNIVLSRQLADLANCSKISHTLRKLVQQAKLFKINQDVFAKP